MPRLPPPCRWISFSTVRPLTCMTVSRALACCVLRSAGGLTVVTADKGPLALDFAGLTTLKVTNGGQLGYSATLCGALPVVNLGLRVFPAADFLSIRGRSFNSTTNFVLAEMENGREFAYALAEAQRRGIAETDPTPMWKAGTPPTNL